jgi:predicted Rossmann fold flavoprotein
MKNFDFLIIGAGPAGLMSAIFASRAGLRTAVFEQTPAPGKKLLTSGGTHCNLTNTLSKELFVESFGRNGRFIFPALNLIDSKGVREFFSKLSVPTVSDDGVHVFPKSQKASDVLNSLLSECEKNNVSLFLNGKAQNIIISNGIVQGVETGHGIYHSSKILVASGGLSYPSLGASGDGYNFAKFAGHKIVGPSPALVELYAAEKWTGELAGLSLKNLKISVPYTKIPPKTGDFLFTHLGISGPVVLDISGEISSMLLRQKNVPISLNFTHKLTRDLWLANFAEWRKKNGTKKVKNLVSTYLPLSLSIVICRMASAEDTDVSHLSAPARDKIISHILACPLTIVGTAGFEKAMLTQGGVDLKEVNPNTLESRKIKGLFFAGEVLDIQGPCGGFNMQWAFSSGALAGKSAAEIHASFQEK